MLVSFDTPNPSGSIPPIDPSQVLPKPGHGDEPVGIGDSLYIFKTNIEQIYGDEPSQDGAPMAEGDISGLADGTLYLGLYEYGKNVGTVSNYVFLINFFLTSF